MTEHEKRRNTRVTFRTTATLTFGDQVFDDCETQNLSLKGVFVRGITGLPVGDHCHIALKLSGTSSDLFLRMSGEVVRVDEEGVAIHFTEIDIDSFHHLKNIVYFNSENPDVVDDELAREIQVERSID